MRSTGQLFIAVLAAATVGAAITALGYELSSDEPTIDYCAAVKSHQVQLRAEAPFDTSQPSPLEQRREARLVVANPSCYTVDEVREARRTLSQPR